jgi:hypothetical protein
VSDRRPTQADQLLALLRERGPAGVTPLDALDRIGSFRLAARVWDLAQAGHRIERRRVTTPGGATIACYVLVEGPQQIGMGLG